MIYIIDCLLTYLVIYTHILFILLTHLHKCTTKKTKDATEKKIEICTFILSLSQNYYMLYCTLLLFGVKVLCK